MSTNTDLASSKTAENTTQLPRGVLGRSGTPFPPGTRLPSIRTPRDLTLTGGSTPKRTFTPNVAASRRTPARHGNSSEAKRQEGHTGRGGRGRERAGRGRGRARGSNLVQLQGGAFADGLAEAEKRKGGSRFMPMSDPSRIAPEKPKYVPSTAAEKEEDEEKLKRLLRDDFIDEDSEGDLGPVALPLSTIKCETGVKEEKVCPEKGQHSVASMTTKVVRRIPVADLCTDKNLPEVGKLLFFQFPDSLPGLVASLDSAPPNSINVRKELGMDGTSTCVKLEPGTKPEKRDIARFKLKEFPEGYVGKVQVMKSGRTKLLLGSVALDIEMGTLVSFHQDAVSLRFVEGGAGDMTVLGKVSHKLICLPDVENLLVQGDPL